MTLTKKTIEDAFEVVSKVVKRTPLQYSERLSEKYGAHIYLKREDLTKVRSFKIRGAYYKMSRLTPEQIGKGIVCASAGNHAQGVAYACSKMKIKGAIFMPVTTPNQKVSKVKNFGGPYVKVILTGNTFDEASVESKKYCEKEGSTYIHPFDDTDVMSGQGTVAYEIYNTMINEDNAKKIDYVVTAIGGGGLISGISQYFKEASPMTKVIGSEPEFADSMNEALKIGKPVTLKKFETFVDGAAVRTTGEKTLSVVKKNVEKVVVVPTGLVCSVMIELYQYDGVVAEPAGALSVAALENIKDEIKGKVVVCVISGGNNDLLRYPEILERSLVYQGRKHYFIVEFAQKPGQLKNFLNHALSPTDDIVRFEYMKKNNKEKGPALVGIELAKKDDFSGLISRMEKIGLTFRVLTPEDLLYQYLI
ncbi:MAG: threonine ammonia-lyase IlvA [Patescibacteria group bacterium]